MHILVVFVFVVLTRATWQQQAPRIELHPNSVIVNVSDPVTLECRVSGEPRPRVSWLKDGHVLDLDHLKSKYTLIHGSNLFIFAATLGRQDKSDAGVYQCRGDNAHGSATSHNATLIITYIRDDFRDMPKSRQVKAGAQVIMECKAPKGHPEPAIHWTKNNRMVEQAGSSVLFGNGTLFIGSAGLSDNGEYVCVAKNEAGVKRTPPAFLNVFAAPTITSRPEHSQHHVKDRVKFRCEASGFPRPQIEWKKDGSYENLPLKSTIDDNSLTIASIEFGDEGEYTCVATNQLASVEHTFTVSVYAKPSFSKHMDNVTIAMESKSLLIECNARGRPAPVIYWAKSADTAQFQSGSISEHDFLILDNGNLFIEKVSQKYAGVYLCQASNEFGTVEAKTVVHVKQLDVRPPPLILQHPQNQTIPVNTQATLECTVGDTADNSQMTTTVKWFKDNKQINVLNSLKYRLLANNHLVINMVQQIDSGLYQCHVINAYSHSTSYWARLRVENPQNQLVAFERNQLSSALPGPPGQPLVSKVGTDSATLSWQSGAHTGHSPIRAYLIEYYSPEWPVLVAGWRLLVDNIPGHVTTYHVTHLAPDTYYTFTVRARNSQGLGPPSALSSAVRTQFRPVFSHSNTHQLIEQALSGQIVQLNEPAQVLTATSINISWTLFASPHLIHGFYVKYRAVGSARDYVLEHLNTTKLNHYVIKNLDKFTTYEILLEPYSGTHRAAQSNTIQAKTLPDTPSRPPPNLHIQLVNSHSLSVKWQAPPTNSINGIVIGYRIHCAANDTAHSLNLNTNATTRAILLTNLIAHLNYCCKVAAYNTVATGPYTSLKCVRMSSATASSDSRLGHFVHQTWFLGVVSLVLASLILLCALYFVWLFYKRRLHIKKSNSKKYLSNNSTLASESRVDKNGNRYKLVGNDAHVWLDTTMRSDGELNTPQYAEVYAPANPYATTGLFAKPEHNLYNILSYQQTMPANSSSYTVKLLNEPEQKKFLKYLQSQTQSQTNTPKVGLKPMHHQQRVKSAENSQVTVNMTQQQLLNYLSHQYAHHSCQQYQQQQQQHQQGPSVPVVPPPSLPQWSEPSNSSSLVSNLTSNSTLSRNGSTFTAQQYVNRIKQLNLQQQQQQDYSSISPEDEVAADEFRFINQKQCVAGNQANQTADDYLNLEADNGQALSKKFLFLNQNNLNSNEIYVSDEMPQTVL